MSHLESYPPVFRQENNHQNQTVDSDDEKYSAGKELPDSDPVPLIDLQWTNLEKFGDACKAWGLFRLVNHGIPVDLMNQLQYQAKKLFSLSFEAKQTMFTTPVSYFWGTPALTPSGDALVRGPQNINWVEGFNVPLSQLSQFQDYGNPMLNSFRVLLDEYGKHMSRIGRTVFETMINTLHLDPKQSESNLSESTGIVRVYRYPKFLKANQVLGMEVHTDSSVLSILNQDQVSGLQVFKDDKWFQVESISGSLIVNLGDMMQAISNEEYKSVKHRVKVNKNEERFSICYFVFPAEGCVIQSSKYKPFTYSDFQAQVQHDIKTVGFKVGLERFKIPE